MAASPNFLFNLILADGLTDQVRHYNFSGLGQYNREGQLFWQATIIDSSGVTQQFSLFKLKQFLHLLANMIKAAVAHGISRSLTRQTGDFRKAMFGQVAGIDEGLHQG